MSDQTGIYGVLRNPSMVDFEGYLAGVFFTSGCNFRCGFCQNPELMPSKDNTLTWGRLIELCRSFRENWVNAVVVTGGEPTLLDNLPELLSFFKRQGFAIKLDTNGSHPDVMQHLISELDYVAMDVKCALPSYPDLTGFQQPERVQASLELLKKGKVDYEFRTTLIPSFHDSDQVEEICKTVAGASKHRLQPFLPREDLPEPRFRNESRTSPLQLKEAADRMDDYVGEVLVQGNT